jgi:hypothetical protein
MPAKRRRSTAPRRYNLSYRPATYWPARKAAAGTDAEIARITVSSSSSDAISLKARRTASGRIAYRMIHEDARGRTPHRIRVQPASSAAPLTLGELIGMLESACYAGPCPDEGDDERFGGVIWGTLRLNLEHGTVPADDYLFLLRIASNHYPQLERYYDARLSDWCLANCIEDDDCGKVVRLRTGRFPRRLML